MTAIANVATTNTFDYWRLRTNEIISFVNTGAANTGATVANTTFQSALANTNLSVSDRLQVANAAALYSTLTQLGNTNSYIATKVNTTTFNSALANTNSYIATKVNTTTFNSALANTNSYIATKVNTTTFNSALANTNSYIATNLANTNLAVSDRLQVANASSTFSSYDSIIITTPSANTEYELFRKIPQAQTYRDIYYSTQFGSANVGFWVGSTLVANVNVSSTANTNTISVNASRGDRVYIHLYDAALSTTANLEFSFGG
jgi:hypothetical protein